MTFVCTKHHHILAYDAIPYGLARRDPTATDEWRFHCRYTYRPQLNHKRREKGHMIVPGRNYTNEQGRQNSNVQRGGPPCPFAVRQYAAHTSLSQVSSGKIPSFSPAP